jgi:hypothetical protein
MIIYLRSASASLERYSCLNAYLCTAVGKPYVVCLDQQYSGTQMAFFVGCICLPGPKNSWQVLCPVYGLLHTLCLDVLSCLVTKQHMFCAAQQHQVAQEVHGVFSQPCVLLDY